MLITSIVFFADMDKYGAIFSIGTLVALLLVAIFLIGFSTFGLVGVLKSKKGLRLVLSVWAIVMLLMVLAEITSTLLLVSWINAMSSAQNEANQFTYDLQVELDDDEDDGGALDDLIIEMNGFICNTYSRFRVFIAESRTLSREGSEPDSDRAEAAASRSIQCHEEAEQRGAAD